MYSYYSILFLCTYLHGWGSADSLFTTMVYTSSLFMIESSSLTPTHATTMMPSLVPTSVLTTNSAFTSLLFVTEASTFKTSSTSIVSSSTLIVSSTISSAMATSSGLLQSDNFPLDLLSNESFGYGVLTGVVIAFVAVCCCCCCCCLVCLYCRRRRRSTTYNFREVKSSSVKEVDLGLSLVPIESDTAAPSYGTSVNDTIIEIEQKDCVAESTKPVKVSMPTIHVGTTSLKEDSSMENKKEDNDNLEKASNEQCTSKDTKFVSFDIPKIADNAKPVVPLTHDSPPPPIIPTGSDIQSVATNTTTTVQEIKNNGDDEIINDDYKSVSEVVSARATALTESSSTSVGDKESSTDNGYGGDKAKDGNVREQAEIENKPEPVKEQAASTTNSNGDKVNDQNTTSTSDNIIVVATDESAATQSMDSLENMFKNIIEFSVSTNTASTGKDDVTSIEL